MSKESNESYWFSYQLGIFCTISYFRELFQPFFNFPAINFVLSNACNNGVVAFWALSTLVNLHTEIWSHWLCIVWLRASIKYVQPKFTNDLFNSVNKATKTFHCFNILICVNDSPPRSFFSGKFKGNLINSCS